MKKLLLASILGILSYTSHGEIIKVENAVGIPFGSTIQAVKDSMKYLHPDAKLTQEGTSNDNRCLFYVSGSWEKSHISVWMFIFDSNNTLGMVKLYLSPDKLENTFTFYEEVCKIVANKYGNERYDFDTWVYPSKATPDFIGRLEAIKSKDLKVYRYWQFNTYHEDTFTDDTTIWVSVKMNDDWSSVEIKFSDGNFYDAVKFYD